VEAPRRHGQQIGNAAWTDYEPTPLCDFIAFYPNKVDTIDVE
jgi:uncharacterized protein (DUF427 family)